MKVVGKIFLLISGILFLAWGITGLIFVLNSTGEIFASKNVGYIIAYFIDIIAAVIQILASLGALLSVFGSRRLSGFVGFFAFFNLIFIIASLVTTIVVGTAVGGIPLWIPSVSTGTAVIFVLGWAFTRK